MGVREEGDDLALGVFTQDLAQDLPQDMRAVDVVTSAVRLHDPTLSDERARSVLGALGLTGEKSLRLVGHLSGGEKARVALARFVLIPHNLLLLDEPSNHLDVATIEVLTGALREFTGSILVISHDKPFLEALEPTHVITVNDGVVSMEARSLQPDDWVVSLSSSRDNGCEDGGVESKFANSSSASGVKSPSRSVDSSTAAGTDTDRKKVFNAPKKVKKVEAAIEKCESEMKEIDALMFENGRNREKLTELQKRKDALQPKLDKLFREYDELLTHIN
jgi:ATPase subunit of ABC transporter with duplicated ATPase domains